MKKLVGYYPILVFLILASLFLLIICYTLAFPGSPVDKIWTINPEGYAAMSAYPIPVIAGFMVLFAWMALAAKGWRKRSLWGWKMTVAIFAANGIGDLARILQNDWVGAITGALIAGLILWYLLKIKNHFTTSIHSKG